MSSSLEGSVKDTIESILVAFMLAFIFRAFVVEAFVIPTGSMAPTLLGAHMRFRCADCGYRFEVNYQGRENGDDIEIPTRADGKTFTVFCPNCGYRVPRDARDDPHNVAASPAVHYGDRILVLKYLYLFEEPKRWDVVVFKSPHDPDRWDYSQNYIKRLVGKPGESIMILDGDIYVGQGSDPSSFKVQSKPRHVQEALWRIVYDNDYYPRKLPREDAQTFVSDPPFKSPWQEHVGQKGWSIGDGSPGHRDFVFDNAEGASTLEFNPSANVKTYSLTDWLAYDVNESRGRDGFTPENNVSDVKLDFFYERVRGDGPLRAQLTKLGRRFEVRLDPQTVTLLMDDKPLGAPARLPQRSGPLHVEVVNADYHVRVYIDGDEVLSTTPEQYQPDLRLLMDAFKSGQQLPKPGVRIVGENQTCTLSHVSLWRDIYYLNRGERKSTRDPMAVNSLWGSPADFPNNLATLEKDQFFVLGDNSLVSLDARFWADDIRLPDEDLYVKAGVVPRRFMLGRAFFVYWPAGYRPIRGMPALAPNFGEMRFIH